MPKRMPDMIRGVGWMLVAVVSGLAAMPARADATGPLPEGESGFFCKTHDGAKRLFRRGDFFYCGTDAHLPARVIYAVLGDAPPGLAPALRRFGDMLAKRAGILIEPGLRPDVLLVASPATPPPKGREAYRRAAAALVAKSGVVVPPDLAEWVLRDITLDLTPVHPSTTGTAGAGAEWNLSPRASMPAPASTSTTWCKPPSPPTSPCPRRR